jgi:endonuclease I
MLRVRALLAAFLLSSPVGAQVVRLPVAASWLGAPAIVAPALSGSVLVSPAAFSPALSFSAASPLSAAAPLAAPVAALAAPVAVAVAAPVAAPALAASAAGAPALPALAAAASDPRRAVPTPGAAQPAAPSDAGRGLFDGSWELRTRSGSVFVPSFAREYKEFPGGFALVRSRPSPAAPVKSLSNAQGLYGDALLARVGELAARNQTYNTYHAASQYLFSTADNHALNGLHGVADAYSGVFIPGNSAESRDYSETGDQAHDGWSRAQSMNVEHVFPQSLFKGEIPMRSDLHHLMAALEHTNGVRDNLPFGVVKGKPDYRNSAGAKRGGGVFEPPDFTKGRVARAMLYFYARYRTEAFFGRHASRFWNSQLETMLDWNRRFPPTVEERRRNDQVEQFQGNRNPFVDDPSLADKIGIDSWRAPMPRAAAASRAAEDASDATSAASRRSDKKREGKPRQSFHRPHQARSGRRR